MTPFEIATGWLFGHGTALPLPREMQPHPRAVLDEILRPALQAERCHVLFSGGRDSSVVLACAIALARREGLPIPSPVTRVFPEDPATSEEDWQRQVLAHLDVSDWVRLEIHDELDVVGPIAQSGLIEHGVVFPSTAYPQAFTFQQLAGGNVLTGEGGDEVFGAQRITPVVALLRRRRRLSPDLVLASARALAPAPIRRRAASREAVATGAYDWLVPAARADARALRAHDAGAEPLWWADGVRHLLRSRSREVGMANLAAVARGVGVQLLHPLMDPRFVASVAMWGGRLGPVGRTETMLRLFGDLLPEQVLRRVTKATFNATAVNRHSAEFIRGWNGDGLDTSLVDVDVLRAHWAEPAPLPATLSLLQQAWLSSNSSRAERVFPA
jgi:asparagine synthase (glutamine-hydrolysing)